MFSAQYSNTVIIVAYHLVRADLQKNSRTQSIGKGMFKVRHEVRGESV